MSDPDLLNVWHERRLVGQLWRSTTGAIGFRYDPAWITSGFAVSRSLPLAVRGEYSEGYAPEESTAQRWFANLLPEGAVRERIVRDLKLPNTDFDLLRAIGGECAGALSVLPVDRQPSGQQQYRALTEKDLADLAARRDRSTWSGRRTSARDCPSPAPRTSARYWCATISIFCRSLRRLPVTS